MFTDCPCGSGRPYDGAPGLAWTGLEVLDATGGGPDDEEGEVEFRATFRSPQGPVELRERSRFTRRRGRS